MPNNRQWAIIIWTALFLLWALLRPDGRKAIRDVTRLAISPIFLLPFTMLCGWCTALLFLASRFGLWNRDLAADTAFWFLGSGIVLFFGITEVGKQDRLIRTTVAQLIGVAIVTDVVLEVGIMHWLIELVVVLLATVLVLVELVAKQRDGDRRVAGFASRLLALAGLTLLAVGLRRIIFDFEGQDWPQLGRQALLAIWLTTGVMPLIFTLGLFGQYEKVWKFVDYHSDTSWRRRTMTKSAIVREHGIRATRLHRLNLGSVGPIAKATTWQRARLEVQQVELRHEDREREECERIQALKDFAGVRGVGDDGRQLDKREFDETCKALRWLHTCHSGWWRREQRYTDGLLKKVSSPSDTHHLHPDAGYTEVVASDGEWWFAWRRTPSGRVFAIAGIGVPHYPWSYDGPEPPTGPPGEDQLWGDDPFASDCAPNWD